MPHQTPPFRLPVCLSVCLFVCLSAVSGCIFILKITEVADQFPLYPFFRVYVAILVLLLCKWKIKKKKKKKRAERILILIDMGSVDPKL